MHFNRAAVGAVLVGGYWADAAVLEHIKGERVVSVCVAYVVNAVENNFDAREVSIGDRIRRGLFEMRGVGVNLTGLDAGRFQDVIGEAGGIGKDAQLIRPVHESVAFVGCRAAAQRDIFYYHIAVRIDAERHDLELGLTRAHVLVGGDVPDNNLLVVRRSVGPVAVIAAADFVNSEMRGVGVNLTGLDAGRFQDVIGEAGGIGKDAQLIRPVHESVAFVGCRAAAQRDIFYYHIAVRIDAERHDLELGLTRAHVLVGGDVPDNNLLVVRRSVGPVAVIAAADLVNSLPNGVEDGVGHEGVDFVAGHVFYSAGWGGAPACELVALFGEL